MAHRVSRAKIIVDGSILIETELLVISLLDSNVPNRKAGYAARFSGDLGESLADKLFRSRRVGFGPRGQ